MNAIEKFRRKLKEKEEIHTRIKNGEKPFDNSENNRTFTKQ